MGIERGQEQTDTSQIQLYNVWVVIQMRNYMRRGSWLFHGHAELLLWSFLGNKRMQIT